MEKKLDARCILKTGTKDQRAAYTYLKDKPPDQYVLFKSEWTERCAAYIKAVITQLISTPADHFVLDQIWTYISLNSAFPLFV